MKRAEREFEAWHKGMFEALQAISKLRRAYRAGFKKAVELSDMERCRLFDAEFATITDDDAEVRSIQHLNRLNHKIKEAIRKLDE